MTMVKEQLVLRINCWFWMIVFAGTVSLDAAPVYQSGTRKPTPDPYFSPQTLPKTTVSPGGRTVTNDFLPVAPVEQKSAAPQARVASRPTDNHRATNRSWLPPKTPVTIAKPKPDSSNKLPNDFVAPAFPTPPVEPVQSPAQPSANLLAPLNDPEPVSSETTTSVITEPATEPVDAAPAGESYQAFEPTQVLAMVAGEPIFMGDVLLEANQMIDRFMPTAPESIKAAEKKKLIKRLLPKFVDGKILYLNAISQLPPEADIESIIRQAEEEFDGKALQQMVTGAGLNSPAELDAILRKQGSSLRKLRRTWSQDQLAKFFTAQQLKMSEEVSHRELLDEYRKRLPQYAIPAKAKWEQIMVRFDRYPSKRKAKEAIVELGNQVVYGANLAAVAKKSSHGFRADTGGQHDWTTQGALALTELDKAIFTLPIGELSDIIETNSGYHLIRITDRTEATHKPFLEAQVEIKQQILNKRREETFQQHLKKLRTQIPVEYFQPE